MSAPLLATKLHPPRRRRTLVDRPRLRALADRSRHRALTLVSAPAGFGKTTLVADWFAGQADDATSAIAWLSLDRRDDDPHRFWTYVVAALESAIPDLGSEASALLEGPGTPLDVVVATLINDLETAAHDVVLVLDDYHLIESPDIHESVAFLLDHLPPQIRLVIATRADPPLPLASLRAAGDLLEVRAADLRFTEEEASTYLGDAMDLDLSADDVAVLEARTEGWIAALQLAALSMQGRDDPAAFVAEFAGDDRFILDYLADEVLERQTREVRTFLLDTSILTRLTGPLCAAVTELDDAKAILDELERANLFLVALDDRRTWYRYHHLFADVLRARLLDDHADRIADLHRRACDWHAEHGDPAEAITHALAADDPGRAADLIEVIAPEMQRTRQESQLRAWLEALPPATYDDRPVLAMALVGARMATGDATGLDPLLATIDRWLATDEQPIVRDLDAHRRLPAMAAIHRAGLALLAGDLPSATRHATDADALAGPTDPLQRGAAAALLGLAAWAQGDLATARRHYERSITCFEDGDYLPDAMGCSIALADIQLTQGDVDSARLTFERALAHTTDRPGLRGAADMHVGLALLAIERGDLDEADRHLRSSAELGEHLGLPQHPYRWRVATARMHEVAGDLLGALTLLTDAEARYVTDFSPSVRPVAATRARIAVALGDRDAGARWASEAGISADDDITYLREFEHLALARILASGDRDDADRATTLLQRLLAAAKEGGRHGSAADIEAALTGATDQPVRNQRSRTSDPDELSDRELDVLRLLRSDLTGPDIARELHVSLNTLRTHTKHIYTKLGATNRREALSRAAERGL